MFFQKILKKLTKAASTEPNYHKDVKSEELDQTLSTCSNRLPKYLLPVGQYSLKEETIFEIGKFAILWSQFEHICCNSNCTDENIKRVARKIDIDSYLQEQLASLFMFYDTSRGTIKLLYPDGSKQPKSEDKYIPINCFLEQKGDIVTLNEGCLLTIYRIRNNMMHGLKDIAYLDVQIELFRAANAILDDILKKYA